MILLKIPVVDALTMSAKYFDSPFSNPRLAILNANKPDVASPINIHHNIPLKSPNPKIPAEIPTKMLAITRLF